MKLLSIISLSFALATRAFAASEEEKLFYPFVAVEGDLEKQVVTSLATTLRLLDRDNRPEIVSNERSYNYIFVSALGSIIDGRVQEQFVSFLRPNSISAIVSSDAQTPDCHLTRLNYKDGSSTVVVVFDDDVLETVSEAMMDCFTRGVEALFLGDEPETSFSDWRRVLLGILNVNMD